MTVANQTRRTSAVGSGAVAQEVPFSFPYAATSDIKVYSRVTATGVETLLAETTNYTLTAASDTGGTLTTVTAVAATSEIHIVRDTPRTQALDLEQGGSFSAEDVEDAIDKNTKLIIENKDSFDRALRAPATDAVALDLEIPNSVDRASKNLGFDASGNVTVTDSSGTFATTYAYWDDVKTKSPAADIRAYGAVAGSTDNSAAIQLALDENKQDIFIPEGTFLGNVSVDGAVNIRGCGPKSILKAYTTDPVITVTERITAAVSGQGSPMGRRFQNFTISGNGKTAKGLYYNYSTPPTVEEEIVAVYFDNCTRGIDFGTLGAIGNTVRYCNFVTCDYGVYARNNGASAQGLNLNRFTENRFRSIILCCIYLNGSDVSLGGNIFNDNWFEGVDGFGIILKGDSSEGLLRRPNCIQGGWFEDVAAVAHDPVTLDDEGITATRTIWLKDTTLISTGGVLPADMLVDGSILNADYYRGAGTFATKNQIVALNDAEVAINDAYLDTQGGVVMKGISTSSLVVRRPHNYGGDNRGFIVEGLPMQNNTAGHTNLTDIQDLSEWSGANLAYQNAQYLGSRVLRCALSDSTERAISSTLVINDDKYYAFSFNIKSSTSSAEEDITFEISGTGDLFSVQTIIARGDRWTHYTGLVWSGSTAPTVQVLKFKTTADATFDLSRLQLVEFSTLVGAEAFLHSQHYSGDDPYVSLEYIVCNENQVVCNENRVITN